MTASIVYVCPACRSSVAREEDAYACAACRRRYPIQLGIPDFRLGSDPWLSIEDDRAKGQTLDAQTRNSTLRETVEAYWAMTPTTSPERARRFTEHVLGAEARSRAWLAVARTRPPGPFCPLDRPGLWHCRSGRPRGFAYGRGRGRGYRLSLAGGRTKASARSTHRQRHAGLRRCGCHAVRRRGRGASAVAGAARTQRSDGRRDQGSRTRARLARRAAVAYVNRYSILSEPHVAVWGVGFLPARGPTATSAVSAARDTRTCIRRRQAHCAGPWPTRVWRASGWRPRQRCRLIWRGSGRDPGCRSYNRARETALVGRALATSRRCSKRVGRCREGA